MKKKTQAFTLLEAMVVVALIGILTAYGLPRLAGFTTNTGLTTNNNDLVTALQFARSASIRLQDRVVVCTSSSSMQPAPVCGAVDTPWHDGWIIFHDLNDNNQYDATDEILRVHPPVTIDGITITPVDLAGTPTNIVNFVSFGPPAGEPTLPNGAAQSGIFRICSNADLTRQRGVLLNFSGRISSTRDQTVINSACIAL